MARDEDIARSLPDSPPPAPARREAAIQAALRRLEATEPPPVTASRTRPGWRASRPQLGALAGVSLALLVGVPLAVQTMNERPITSGLPERTSAAKAAREAADVSQQKVTPPLQMPAPAPLPREAPEPNRAETAVAESVEAERSIIPSSPAPKAERRSVAALPPSAYAAVSPQAIARASPAIMAVAPPAPPPPIPPPASAAPAAPSGLPASERRAARDVVVTGARAVGPLRPIDAASACTIDDPRRRLDLCRDVINPGAPGREGRAAACVADGLSRAWEGDLDGAVAAFEQAIAIAPRSSIGYLNRGLVRQRRGDLESAVADLNRAVENAPNSAQATDRLARLLRQRGEASRATNVQKRANDNR